MKLKQLREKDLPELKKMLADAKAELPMLQLEKSMRKDKNIKIFANKRREVGILLGMVRAREMSEK